MKLKHLLFWQPSQDLLKRLLSLEYGNMLLVLLNYVIWFFFLFISHLLVFRSPNSFWQILVATILAELIEKKGKKMRFWKRPLYTRNDEPPPGLVERWYKTGSFPSGHTIKSVYFFLFVLQYQVFHPLVYILIIAPLIVFRVLVGFHYPIDILGGSVIGLSIWALIQNITFPNFLVNLIKNIYNFVFLL